MTLACPVCAAPNGVCGHTELAFPPITAPQETNVMASNEGTIYLARQHIKRGRGKPGYKGANIKVVDDPAKARAADEAKAAKSRKSDKS
jgi:hypothetical protein